MAFNKTNHQGNARQNHNEISLYTIEWLLSKGSEITNVGKITEKEEISKLKQTNWKLAESLFYNKGYEERSQSRVRREEKYQVRTYTSPTPQGGDSQEERDYKDSEILPGEWRVCLRCWDPIPVIQHQDGGSH